MAALTPSGWSDGSTVWRDGCAKRRKQRPEFSYYLLNIGIAHSHRAQGPGGTIPPHLMVGAMSLAQTALAGIFADELERSEAAAASAAWNKLLLVHLSVLLLSYLPPRRLP